MDSLRTWALLALIPASVLLWLSDLSTFQLAKAVLVGPALAVLLVSQPYAIRPARPVLWAATFVPLIGVGALIRWVAPGTAAWELWFDLLFLGALVMGAQLRGTGSLFLAAVAAGGGAVIVVTALEAVGVGPLCPAAITRAGTMGNPNFSGAVLALAAPASLALALNAGARTQAVAWAALLAVSLAATAWLGAWTGAVGAGVGLSAVAVHGLIRRGRASGALIVALLVLLGGGAALLSGTVRGHLADRGYMARVSLNAAATRPLTGHGLGGFPRAFLDAQAEILKENPDERSRWTRALHAHSEPLHALVERGLFGLLAWLGLWGAISWVIWRRGGSPGLTGVLAAGLALSLGEFPGHLVPIQLTLGLAAGLVGLKPSRDRSPKGAGVENEHEHEKIGAKAPPTGRRLMRHLLWIPALLLFLIPAWLAASDRAFNGGDPANALLINPWNGRAAFAVALAEQEGGAPMGCAHAGVAERLLPSPASAMALGLCEARRGHNKEGIEALRRATRWNPRNAAAHANLAILLLEAGDVESARRHALRASSLRPGDPKIRRIHDVLLLE